MTTEEKMALKTVLKNQVLIMRALACSNDIDQALKEKLHYQIGYTEVEAEYMKPHSTQMKSA